MIAEFHVGQKLLNGDLFHFDDCEYCEKNDDRSTVVEIKNVGNGVMICQKADCCGEYTWWNEKALKYFAKKAP